MVDEETPLDPELDQAARAYHQPPADVPREAMWTAIAARRARPERRVPRYRRAVIWAAGVAAVLAIGVGIGRLSVHPPGGPRSPTVAPAVPVARKDDGAAYRLATADHLGQAEAFLTLFRASLREGHQERLASATARRLLATNRLLLDSPAAGDPKLKLLLQDLELVLAQIAQLEPGRRTEDSELITDGLDAGMLVRLRAAVPAGAVVTSRQGAL